MTNRELHLSLCQLVSIMITYLGRWLIQHYIICAVIDLPVWFMKWMSSITYNHIVSVHGLAWIDSAFQHSENKSKLAL